MKTVLLSAGHGGRDPGASYNNVREKDANLAIALACRNYLKSNFTDHNIVMARDSDVWVSLPDRRELTRRVNADLYVSIHNNAYSIASANGYSTYLHSGPLFGATIGYRDIIHNTVYDYVKTLGVRDRGKKRGDHWVTREMPAPTVLMEYMFVSNPREAALLQRADVLQGLGKHTALGIAKALNLAGQTTPPLPIEPPVINPPPGPGTIPVIQRLISVRVNGKPTNEVGYLINNTTHLQGVYLARLGRIKAIKGYGDYIDITTE